MPRVERKAAELKKGDRVDVRGRLWSVVKVKVRGKHVRLVLSDGRREVAGDVRAKARYTVVGEAPAPGRPTKERPADATARGRRQGPLLDAEGRQTRWVTPKDLEAPSNDLPERSWDTPTKVERPLVTNLSARLVGVEVEGGKLIVPPVTDTTVLGHLLTMHGVRYDGATFAEAKAWAREHDLAGTVTAQQVLDALTLEGAYRIHDDLHADVAAMERPHWHREKAPK